MKPNRARWMARVECMRETGRIYLENLKGIDRLGDFGVEGRII
jgi:hypothetical protein